MGARRKKTVAPRLPKNAPKPDLTEEGLDKAHVQKRLQAMRNRRKIAIQVADVSLVRTKLAKYEKAAAKTPAANIESGHEKEGTPGSMYDTDEESHADEGAPCEEDEEDPTNKLLYEGIERMSKRGRRMLYKELLESLPTEAHPPDAQEKLKKMGFRGSPYLGRATSRTPGHIPGFEGSYKRCTNGHTAQDVLLPAAVSRRGQVPRPMIGTTIGDIIYMLAHHLAWKDLLVDMFLSYSSDFLFLFIHGLNRHSESQGDVTIGLIDRRKCEDQDGKPVPFIPALSAAEHFQLYDQGWDWFMQDALHPRKFSHEYLTWGPIRHRNRGLKQASIKHLIRDGLFIYVPMFETPQGHARVGMYSAEVTHRGRNSPAKKGARNVNNRKLPSRYSYSKCARYRRMRPKELRLVRKLALNFGTAVSGSGEPHLYAFLNLLTFYRRRRGSMALLVWIAARYTAEDVADLYLDAHGKPYDGITEVAKNLPGVMQYLDLLRDCISLFPDLPALPENIVQTTYNGVDFVAEDDRLQPVERAQLFWSIAKAKEKKLKEKEKAVKRWKKPTADSSAKSDAGASDVLGAKKDSKAEKLSKVQTGRVTKEKSPASKKRA